METNSLAAGGQTVLEFFLLKAGVSVVPSSPFWVCANESAHWALNGLEHGDAGLHSRGLVCVKGCTLQELRESQLVR